MCSGTETKLNSDFTRRDEQARAFVAGAAALLQYKIVISYVNPEAVLGTELVMSGV